MCVTRDEVAPTSGPAANRPPRVRPGRRRRPTSRCSRPRRRPSGSACSTTTAAETRHPLTEQTLGIWHGAVPGRRAGPALRLPRRRAVGAGAAGCGSTRTSCCSTPTPARSAASSSAGPGDLRLRPSAAPTGAATAQRLRAVRCRAASSCTTTSTGATTGRCDGAGATPSSTSCTSRASPSCTTEVPEELRGTYAGLATPAVTDYLKDLGVTAVELLPVHQFVSEPAVAARGLTNYWGYNSIGFFAPHAATPRRGDRGAAGHRVQGDGQGAATRPGSR